MAKLLITGNIKFSQHVHVSQASMVKQMWENLTAMHEIHGQQSITALRHTLYHTKAVEGDDIVAHVNKMRSHQATLHQMGSIINDEDFKSILVSSLPVTWDAFTASYLGSQTGTGTGTGTTMKSQELVALIRDEYNRRKTVPGLDEGIQNKMSLSITMAAQMMKRPKGKKRVQEKNEKGDGKGSKGHMCTICFQDNHATEDCFHKGKPKCNNCRKFGHKAADCWSPAVGKKTKGIPTQSGKCCKVKRAQHARDVQEDEEMTDAMYVTQQHTSPDITHNIPSNVWLADSATSLHILNKKEAYHYLTPFQTHVKGIGDVLVLVEGKGSVELKSWVNEKDITIVLPNVLYVPSTPNCLVLIT